MADGEEVHKLQDRAELRVQEGVDYGVVLIFIDVLHGYKSSVSVAVRQDLLQWLIIPQRQEGRRSLQSMLLTKPRNITKRHLLDLLLLLVLIHHVLVGQVKDVICVDVQFNLVQFVDLDALE